MTMTHASDTENDALDVAPRSLDVDELGTYLLGRWADIRRDAREFIREPEMQGQTGLSMSEHRSRVFGQLQRLADRGVVHRAFPTEVGGFEDHGGHLAAFEELVAADPSMQIKAGVQWGLFASAIQHLGTADHHLRWLPDALSLKLPGVYAMTETGHGSDVASIGTTATYDEHTEEWIIHTPFRGAWKDYLGNAAEHGKAAVVFAQLITKNVNHGVHAFFVPIRDDHGVFFPGIGGDDDGVKGGLNGIDNGRLHFDHVRVPRTNLLNRYGDVAPDGTYSSPIESPGRRFFTMLGTLVQGRVSLDGASANAMKIALQIAVTYSNQRRQFDGPGGRETVLLDYQRHQRRLIPLIARTYAVTFAHGELLEKFDAVFGGSHDSDAHRQDLETFAAALKPLSTWAALETLQECREACGGQGFLAENRLVGLRADLDIYATFEGDNTVLLQLVAKRLLTDFGKKLSSADRATLVKFVVGKAADRTLSNSGLRRLSQDLRDLGSTARSVGQLRDEDTQRDLLTDRVETMVSEMATQLRDAKKAGNLGEVTADLQSAFIDAAIAHGELLQWEAFTDALSGIDNHDTREVLTWVRNLFGLTLVEKHLAWYLLNGRLSAARGHAVTAYVNRLIGRLRPYAQDLVDAFGYQPEHLRAEIATGVELIRQEQAYAYVRQLEESGLAPEPEMK